MTCIWCGLPMREGDEHGATGRVRADGSVPVMCRVTVLVQNPRRLGVITDIQGDEGDRA